MSMTHTSAYDAVYAAVTARLERPGVRVGKTASLPRVEVHTITEGQRMDKGGDVRQMDLTVESIGNASLDATVSMNEENLRLLTEEPLALEGWRCFGVVPDQLKDLTETSDTAKIVYRLLQSFTIWVERVQEAEAQPGQIGDADIVTPPEEDISM